MNTESIEYQSFGEYEYLAKNTKTGYLNTIKSKRELQIGDIVIDGDNNELIIIEKM